MQRVLAYCSVAILIVFCSSVFASADIIQDLTVDILLTPCPTCFVNVIPNGGGASGYADFGGVQPPWYIQFATGPASSWYISGLDYVQFFDQGGLVTMNGPDGLTFNGIVTGGQAFHHQAGALVANLFFSGQWSNGIVGRGEIDDCIQSFMGCYGYGFSAAHLVTFADAPEPASLALLLGGVGGIWGTHRRFRACV